MIGLTYRYAQPEVELDASGIALDDTWRTSILISLLTHARVRTDEARDATLRGGFWADAYPEVEGDVLGSKLHLLSGRTVTPDALADAEQWAKEALQWMIDDGIAVGIDVVASRVGHDILDLDITIDRPDELTDQYLGVWESQLTDWSL